MNEPAPVLPEVRLRAALARSRVARRRGAAGAAEALCEETAARLFDHLDPVRLEPGWVIDLAMQCGMRDRLAERFPDATVVACGYCPAAFASGPGGRTLGVTASPLALPLAAGSADFVASNLGMCWFTDPGARLPRGVARASPGWAHRFRDPRSRDPGGASKKLGDGG